MFAPLLLAASCLCSAVAQAVPVVAVSIKPLEHLVAELTSGITQPQLVVRTGQDPHHISLRPSERRALADADLLVWVGPSMELPLAELLSQLDADVVTAEQIDGMQLIDAAGGRDPHLWLDTRNAERIASVVVAQLQSLDATNSAQYAANLAAFRERMQQLRARATQQFAATDGQAWAVYHHAFRYTEAEFGLPAALLLRDSDNVEPGLRSVRAFRMALQNAGLRCIVVEPDVQHGQLQALLDDADLRTVEADVLGINLPVQSGSFAALIDGVLVAIQSCAGAKHE